MLPHKFAFRAKAAYYDEKPYANARARFMRIQKKIAREYIKILLEQFSNGWQFLRSYNKIVIKKILLKTSSFTLQRNVNI